MTAEGQPSETWTTPSSYWTNFTSEFREGIDVSNFAWDSIFAELDDSFI